MSAKDKLAKLKAEAKAGSKSGTDNVPQNVSLGDLKCPPLLVNPDSYTSVKLADGDEDEAHDRQVLQILFSVKVVSQLIHYLFVFLRASGSLT